MKVTQLFTRTTTCILCSVIIVSGIIVSAILCINSIHSDEKEDFCVFLTMREYDIYYFTWMSLYIYVPAISILSLNTLIIKKLHSRRKFPRIACHEQRQRQRRLHEATKTIVTASLAFMFLLIPSGVSIIIIYKYNGIFDPTVLEVVHFVTLFMGLFNHMINFIIYVVISKTFRQKLKHSLLTLNCCINWKLAADVIKKKLSPKTTPTTECTELSSTGNDHVALHNHSEKY